MTIKEYRDTCNQLAANYADFCLAVMYVYIMARGSKFLIRLCVTIENKKLSMAIVTIVLIIVLLFAVTVYPVVSARAIGLITIVGTVTIGVAALASLLMITFGASGMDGALRNQAAVSGTEPLTYMGQLINRFAASGGGILPQTFAAKVAAGLSYLSNGDLYFDADATAAIADFQRWAWDVDGGDLVSYAPVVDSDVITVNGIDITIVELGDPVITYRGSTYHTSIAFTEKAGSVISSYGIAGDEHARFYACGLHSASNARVFYVYPYNALSYRTLLTASNGYLSLGNAVDVSTDQWYTIWSAGTWTSNYTSIWPDSLGDVSDLPTDMSGYDIGVVAIGDPNTFVGPMQQGQGTMLPLSSKVQVSADAAANLHLSNYLRVLASAYAGTGTADLPVTDVGTGEDELLPLSVPLDTPIGVVGVTDAAIDQSGSIAGSDAVASDFAGTDDFTMDLTRFFPFCIPFDLYAVLTKFETAAEAPVINWTFDFGRLGTYPLSLDFSSFDSLAALLRDLETVAFAVGLMLVTKRLIQGGD